MNVRQLMELLEGLDDKTEVRIMSQYHWPFEYSISGSWQPDRDGLGDFTPDGNPESGVIYLNEGTQLAYGTKRSWDEEEKSSW